MLFDSNSPGSPFIQPDSPSGSRSHLAFLQTRLDAIISLTLFKERRSLSP